MRRLSLRVLLVASLIIGLAPAAVSTAAEAPARRKAVAETGTGAAVKPVANIQYADRYKTGKNQGTDLEFTTLPVSSARAAGRNADAVPERQYAVAGSYDNGMHIIDITDPTKPEVVGIYDCGVSQGDVQIFKRDGRTYATYTMDAGYTLQTKSKCVEEAKALGLFKGTEVGLGAVDVYGALGLDEFGRAGIGTYIADITDPTNPKTVSYVASAKGAHNMTVHPSGNYLYESNSQLYTTAADAGIEVFDIRDFSKPQRVAKLTLPPTPGLGSESHDLTFNAAGTRAYSAALSQTVVINTENPAAPKLVSVIVDPSINVHHQSDPVTLKDSTTGQTRDFLIIEDEVAGALGTGQCPNGGVHVYDITGPLENRPLKVGYWNIDEVRQTDKGITNTGVSDPPWGALEMNSCTAHVFDIHPEQALMTIAYYNGGVRVVDLSGLVGVALGKTGVGMKQLGFYRFPDSNTWAVKAPFVDRKGFYMYGNDQDRGFDVYRYQPDAAAQQSIGQWLTPAQIDARAATQPKVALTAETAPYCLLRNR